MTMNLTRELVAAWLRARGYTHDDDTDPRDFYWRHPHGLFRPMLSCLATEIDRDSGATTMRGWDTYPVAVGVPADGA